MNPGIYWPFLFLGGLGLSFEEESSAYTLALEIFVSSLGTMPERLQASIDLGEENLTCLLS